MNIVDLIVIGLGPSAVYLLLNKNKKLKTIAFDKNKEIMMKFLLTGGGEHGGGCCNVTNNVDVKTLNENMLYSNKFMYSAFTKYGPSQIREFLLRYKILTEVSEGSTKVRLKCKNPSMRKKFFDQLANDDSIELCLGCSIKTVRYLEDKKIYLVIDQDKKEYYSKRVVIATGGLSFSNLGSTGDGYKFCQQLGIKTTRTFPMGTGIVIDDFLGLTQQLQGVSLKNVTGTIISSNKVLVQEKNDLMITHYGFGGPLMRRLSGYVSYHSDLNLQLKLSFLTTEEILKELTTKDQLNQCFKMLPEKFVHFMFDNLKLNAKQKLAEQRKEDRLKIINYLTNLTFNIKALNKPMYAISTGGGVDVTCLNSSTMESKKYKGLYFIGEVLGVSPKTGGFNMTVCFASALQAINHINNDSL
ncbi:aminoacetone oxidase family FAD-binding enzyme [Ureaplasma canigenitalium]|uniref:aminoacetone oxidase family FAD-binding enzyme n=1 Tax=Ureaplasma canigenitalium TaxID=42092 RepID=UPI0004E20BF3|nr:aminoacetone oxidase family FAD-binding enzyme [Ureaplasma canigenitalium]